MRDWDWMAPGVVHGLAGHFVTFMEAKLSSWPSTEAVWQVLKRCYIIRKYTIRCKAFASYDFEVRESGRVFRFRFQYA